MPHDFSKLSRVPQNTQVDKFASIDAQLKVRLKALDKSETPAFTTSGILIAEPEKTTRRIARPKEQDMTVTKTTMSAQPEDDEDDFDERFSDDDEEEGDEEDDEEVELDLEEEEVEDDPSPPPPKLVAPPAPPKRRGRPPKNKAPVEQPVIAPDALNKELRKTQFNNDANNLYAAIEDLDLGAGNHKFTLVRTRPEYYHGEACTGFLRTYNSPIQPEDIKNQYGGGSYVVTITGPMPNGKHGIVARRTVNIAGDPLIYTKDGVLKKDPKEKQAQDSASTLMPMLEQVLKTKDEDARRAQAEAKEMQKLMLQTMKQEGGGMKDIFATLAAAMNPSGMREEMREERRAQEERLQREREERRHEQERQHQQFMLQLEQQREENRRQLEIMKMEQQKQQNDAVNNVARSESMFRDFLTLSEKMNSEKEQRARESSQFIIEAMKAQNANQIQALQEVEKMKTQFFTEQMKLLKGNDEFSSIDKLIKLKDLLGTLTGNPDGDNRATWEKVFDRLGEAANSPATLALAGQLLSGRGVQAPAQNPQPAQLPAHQPPPGPRPGSVAVVDLPPPQRQPQRRKSSPMLRRERPQERPQERPAQPPPAASVQKAQQMAPPEVIVDAPPDPADPFAIEQQPETPQVVEVQVQQQPQEEQVNDLTEFTYPVEGMSTEEVITLLVKNIDLAVQRDMVSGEVFNDVIKKFPVTVLALFKMVEPGQAVGMIKEAAPPDWYINTPSGQKMIQELFELLKEP